MPHKTSKRRNGWGSLKRHIQRLVTLGFLLLGVFPTDVPPRSPWGSTSSARSRASPSPTPTLENDVDYAAFA
jgi:hypothetical protein